MTDELEMVSAVLTEIGEEFGYEILVNPAPDTELFGGQSEIDSLTLVRIVAELERVAEAKFGRPVILADERAMSRRNSPFRTVRTLADFVGERVRDP